jgi:Icc-related predicted phosphoesterase
MKKLKIWHISDTHGEHHFLSIPEGIDMVIHSGDAANPKNPYTNEPAFRDFLNWFKDLPIKYKIFVAGNHDSSVEKRLISRKDFELNNIIYLEHESVQIEGLNIFGSPYTPEFHQWSFNVKREKLHKYWEAIPENTDILVTHGPPKYILDNDMGVNLGCTSLYKRVKLLPNLKIHQFGHIHNRISSNEIYINRGIFQQPEGPKFINASCVDLRHVLLPGNIVTEINIP